MSRSFNILTGHYQDILGALKFPAAFYETQSQEMYVDEVKKDIERTPYFVTPSQLESHKKSLSRVPVGDLNYAQGNFDARIFSYIAIMNLNPALYMRLESELPHKTARFGYSYRDDDGVLCGVAMTYVEGSVFGKTEDVLNCAIIRNVAAAPKDRQVVFISSEELLVDAVASAPLFAKDFSKKVQDELKSAALFNAIKGVLACDKDSFRQAKVLQKFSSESILDQKIELILEKSTELRARGYDTAADEAKKLHKVLIDYKQDVYKGKLTCVEYVEKAKSAIKTVQQSGELRHHRGFLGQLFHKILVLLNVLTLGHVKIKATDSMQKINQVFFALKEIDDPLRVGASINNLGHS